MPERVGIHWRTSLASNRIPSAANTEGGTVMERGGREAERHLLVEPPTRYRHMLPVQTNETDGLSQYRRCTPNGKTTEGQS